MDPSFFLGNDFPSDADDFWNLRFKIVCQIAIVFITVRFWHQQAYVVANQLFRRKSKQGFGRRVDRFDDASFRDCNNRVNSAVMDRFERLATQIGILKFVHGR